MTDKLTEEFPPVDFWRSLRYFNLYRLALASLFVFPLKKRRQPSPRQKSEFSAFIGARQTGRTLIGNRF